MISHGNSKSQSPFNMSRRPIPTTPGDWLQSVHGVTAMKY